MQAREREIKLIVPDDFELPSLVRKSTGVTEVVEEPPLDLRAAYFDTPGLELLAHGVTVRRREGEASSPVWTVKLPDTDDATLRTEVTVMADGVMPGEISTLLRTILGGDNVAPIAELRTQRRRWTLRNGDGESLAELCDDCVSVVVGNETALTFREIEVEARGADLRGLKSIARQIAKAGGERDQVSKLGRALKALRPAEEAAGEPATTPDDPVADAVRAALADQTRGMVAYAPNAFLGDPEGVHRMRVRQRALRSIVRSFAPLVDTKRLAPVVDDLRWLGSALGDVRDLDVLEVTLRELIGTDDGYTPLFESIRVRLATARANLRAALSSARYEDLIRTLRSLAADARFVTSTGTCRDELPAIAVGSTDRLRKAGSKLSASSPEDEYHEMRKLAKRARYTAETVAMFVNRKRESSLQHFASRITGVQSIFGRYQDATVARDRLIAIAHDDFALDGPMSLRIGRLVEKADEDASTLRRACLRAWNRSARELSNRWPRV